MTVRQMEAWAADFDSWDVCDQATTSLFDLTAHAWPLAVAWARRDEPWVKRGGFALMAGLAVHDRAAPDRRFLALLPVIARGAADERNFVKKAVSWALRNVGKRNAALNAAAIACAVGILAVADRRVGGGPTPRPRSPGRRSAASQRGADPATRAARWVALDALRELRSEKVQERLARRTP